MKKDQKETPKPAHDATEAQKAHLEALAAFRKLREAELVAEYGDVVTIVTGSLQLADPENGKNKASVEILCCDCGEARRIATSDLFQTRRCQKHQREYRRRKTNEERRKSTKLLRQHESEQ